MKFHHPATHLHYCSILFSIFTVCLYFTYPVPGLSARLKVDPTHFVYAHSIIPDYLVRPDTLITPQDAQELPSTQFIHFATGLPHFATLVNQHATVKVAFLGGSITDMKGWRQMIMDYLVKNYTQTKFQFLNAGIPSLGSVPHAFRFQEDVLHQMTPDLLFIESAVNDAGNGTKVIEQRRALEGIIRHAHLANPRMDIVLMAFADENKNADYARGDVPAAVQVHQQLAAYYHFPFINLAKEVYTRINRGEFSWEKDFKNLHPAPFGQRLYFHSIRTLLDSAVHCADKKKNKGQLSSLNFSKPVQALNYANGHYTDPEKAFNLKGFKLINDWTPKDHVNTRPGFVHVPVLCATVPGSQLALKFKGTTVGIAVVSGPDAGIIRYRIDGGPAKTMDLYTRWSNQLHLPWYEILGDGLSSKEHVLTIKVIARKISQKDHSDTALATKEKGNLKPSGNAVRIVHFLVNGPA